MPDVNIDFGDGAVQTPNNGGGTGEGVADITGNNPKPNDVDITGKDNNNEDDKGGNNNPDVNPDGKVMVIQKVMTTKVEMTKTLLRGG